METVWQWIQYACVAIVAVQIGSALIWIIDTEITMRRHRKLMAKIDPAISNGRVS